MRADRLVSLVLLLRQRGRLSADTLAAELEVSTRTVLRDIEALSSAGVPVFAERGRHGGFELLPGFRTELTDLGHDEVLALLTAGAKRGAHVFGLGSALASGMRKLIDALPESQRSASDTLTQRFLIDPDADLLARPRSGETIPADIATSVRRAVFAGHRLRINYRRPGAEPSWRTIDPIGLVTAEGISYLLASSGGEDRTYRLSRILEVEEIAEAADRPDNVDLESLWRERSERFRTGGDTLRATLRLSPTEWDSLAKTALSMVTIGETKLSETEAGEAGLGELGLGGAGGATGPDVADGQATDLLVEASFHDLRHAEWALWQIGPHAEVLEPNDLRRRLHDRAATMAERHSDEQ